MGWKRMVEGLAIDIVKKIARNQKTAGKPLSISVANGTKPYLVKIAKKEYRTFVPITK